MASYGKGENEFRIEITDGDLADPQRKSAIKALLDEWQADPSIKLEIPPQYRVGFVRGAAGVPAAGHLRGPRRQVVGISPMGSQ